MFIQRLISEKSIKHLFFSVIDDLMRAESEHRKDVFDASSSSSSAKHHRTRLGHQQEDEEEEEPVVRQRHREVNIEDIEYAKAKAAKESGSRHVTRVCAKGDAICIPRNYSKFDLPNETQTLVNVGIDIKDIPKIDDQVRFRFTGLRYKREQICVTLVVCSCVATPIHLQHCLFLILCLSQCFENPYTVHRYDQVLMYVLDNLKRLCAKCFTNEYLYTL